MEVLLFFGLYLLISMNIESTLQVIMRNRVSTDLGRISEKNDLFYEHDSIEKRH